MEEASKPEKGNMELKNLLEICSTFREKNSKYFLVDNLLFFECLCVCHYVSYLTGDRIDERGLGLGLGFLGLINGQDIPRDGREVKLSGH